MLACGQVIRDGPYAFTVFYDRGIAYVAWSLSQMIAESPTIQPGLEFDGVEHSYCLDGRRVVSVTQAIKELIDGAWFTDEARWWGNCVHRCVELYEADKLDETLLDERLKPILMKWIQFKAENKYFTLAPEIRLAHDRFKYAGTIDNLGVMHDGPATIDLKSSAGRHAWWAVQVQGGYSELVRHNAKLLGFDRTDLKHRKSYILRLPREGNYKLIPCKDLMPDAEAADLFNSCLKIHHFRNKGNSNA